jgi:hypothetical protein
MHDHLLMCGNKTNQCPICQKYVRKAIFDYHCDNNCVDPDKDNALDEKSNELPSPRRPTQATSRTDVFNTDNGDDNDYISRSRPNSKPPSPRIPRRMIELF